MPFTPGRTGKLFSEFALTLAGAVIVSGFVALTLAPMLSSKLLKHETNPGKFYLKGEAILNAITAFYSKVLAAALNRKAIIIGLGILTILGTGALYKMLPEELSPVEDRGFVIGFSIAPEGASTEFVDRYARQVEGLYSQLPETEKYFMIVGFPSATNSISFLGVQDWEDRERSVQEISGGLMGANVWWHYRHHVIPNATPFIRSKHCVASCGICITNYRLIRQA